MRGTKGGPGGYVGIQTHMIVVEPRSYIISTSEDTQRLFKVLGWKGCASQMNSAARRRTQNTQFSRPDWLTGRKRGALFGLLDFVGQIIMALNRLLQGRLLALWRPVRLKSALIWSPLCRHLELICLSILLLPDLHQRNSITLTIWAVTWKGRSQEC